MSYSPHFPLQHLNYKGVAVHVACKRNSVQRLSQVGGHLAPKFGLPVVLAHGSGLGGLFALGLRFALVPLGKHNLPAARDAFSLAPVADYALPHTKCSGKFSYAASDCNCMFKFVHGRIITYVFNLVNTNGLSQW